MHRLDSVEASLCLRFADTVLSGVGGDSRIGCLFSV